MNKLTSGFLQADLGSNHKDIKIKRLKKKAANQPIAKQPKIPQAPLEVQRSVEGRENTTQDEIQFIKNDTTMSNSHS